MLHLSTKMFYAIEAVLFIAYNGNNAPISSREIANRQNLPPRYLEQIMQALVHSSILRGVRGPRGGYVLARERRHIALSDICKVIRDIEPLDPSQFQQTPLSQEIAFPLYQQLEQALMGKLANETIAGLCDKAAAAKISKDNETPADFII